MQDDIDRNPPYREHIVNSALTLLEETSRRWTSSDFEKALIKTFALNRRQAQRVVRELVQSGKLAFSYEHGCSFLEQSFYLPRRISGQLTLVPAALRYNPVPGETVVILNPGAAFGTGRHPTTRLALQGVAEAWESLQPTTGSEDRVLDIGTGSGVLLIAALKLGMPSGIGVDTDPCACAEARISLSINQLSNRAEILQRPVKEGEGRFSLICANLRYPTLARMSAMIAAMLETGGRVVASGIKTEEAGNMLRIFEQDGLICQWRQSEKGWDGLVMKNK